MGKRALAVCMAAALWPWAAQAGKAHVHGVMEATVAVQGGSVSISLVAPLDSLVGFERAPRTSAEKAAAQAALQVLEQGTWLKLPPAAACVTTQTTVQAEVLKGGKAPADGHADALADYELTCSNPQALTQVEFALFEQFKALRTLKVEAVSPKGQQGLSLQRRQKPVLLLR